MGVDLLRVDLVGGHLIKIQLLKVWKTLTGRGEKEERGRGRGRNTEKWSNVKVCHQRLSSAFDLLMDFLCSLIQTLTLTPPP